MAKIIGIDGKEVKPEETPKVSETFYATWIIEYYNMEDQDIEVYGVLGMNPVFVYVADENGNILVIVPMDKLNSVTRKDTEVQE